VRVGRTFQAASGLLRGTLHSVQMIAKTAKVLPALLAAVYLTFLHFALCAQSHDSEPSFAVASIKPSTSEENGYVRWFPGGRLRAAHVPLRFLIRFAYDLAEDRLTGGPKWVSDDFFDVEATPGDLLPAEPNNDNTPQRLMLRRLLRERFHLGCHFESRTLPVLVLSVGKGGPNLVSSPPDRALHIDVKNNGAARTFVFEGAPSSNIVRNLSGQLKQTVLDHTGLTGHYEGKLEWSFDMDDAPADASFPSLYSALQQQLGLRLQIEKTPVDVLVIDSVDRPDAN
jgi:uncharacterized protein (TIGR03435 family)